MWQRFTERSRKVVFFAQEEARRRGETLVSPEHLLLGLVCENDSVAARILDRMGISTELVRTEVESLLPVGSATVDGDMQLSPKAKRIIDRAFAESSTLNNNYIGTEHLLLALIGDDCVAGQILTKLGAELNSARHEVQTLQEGSLEVSSTPSTAMPPGNEPAPRNDREAFWVHFTERARKIVFYAQEEAVRLGENYVSTEHVLLGLVRENDSVAARILDRVGVSLGRVRSEIERQLAHGNGHLGQDLQLTPRAKRVFDLAYDESRQLNNNYIGTEHLLLGLIREGEGVAGRVLSKLGVDLQRTRREVVHLQEGGTDNGGVWNSRWRANADAAGTNLQRLISNAATEAKELGHDAPSSEHFLIALFTAEDGRASDVMKACGITRKMVEKVIASLA